MLFKDNAISVKQLKQLWPDEYMEHLNYANVMLIFDKDGYSSEEYDEIYNWFRNVIKCNHLHQLDTFEFLGQGGKIDKPYDSCHENARGLICYIENCDLQIIKSAHELYEMYVDGYDSYYICPKSKII